MPFARWRLSGNALKHWRYARSCIVLCSVREDFDDLVAGRHGLSEEVQRIR
jgi:hypothetical protein